MFRVVPGNSGGGNTFGHWQLALAYGCWLSPPFQEFCNQVIRAHFEGNKTSIQVQEPPTRISPAASFSADKQRVYLFEKCEEHILRCQRVGQISENKAASMITAKLQEFFGITFEEAQVTHVRERRPEVFEASKFPYTAVECNKKLRPLLERLIALRIPYRGNTASEYKAEFASIMRHLGIHPTPSRGYSPSVEQIEESKKYAALATMRVPNARIKTVRFNDAAVERVKQELLREIGTFCPNGIVLAAVPNLPPFAVHR